jgi:hypothetical protein
LGLPALPLRDLFLADNNIADAGASALAAFLAPNRSLRRLVLANGGYRRHARGRRMSHVGVAALCQALSRNTALRHLDLDHNNLSGTGLLRVAKMLASNTGLASISLAYTEVALEDICAFCQSLKLHNFSLQHCVVSGSNLNWEHGVWTELLRVLARNRPSWTQAAMTVLMCAARLQVPRLPYEIWRIVFYDYVLPALPLPTNERQFLQLANPFAARY